MGTTSYSTLTPKEVHREIKAIQKTAEEYASSRAKARAFLVSAGILSRDGKHLRVNTGNFNAARRMGVGLSRM
jgi:hypothetical protein